MQNVYRFVVRKIYKTLGPEKSSKLAQSLLGKAVFSLLNPDSDSIQVYSGIDGLKLKLTRDESYSLGFFHLGVINPFETDIIKKVLRKGDTFIDIGAYIDGWHSLVAAKIVGNKGKVYTFEPMYFNRLNENIRINGLKNVFLSDVAISDKNGQAFFYDESERSSLIKNHIHTNGKKIKVKTQTLDSFISQNKIKNPKLIKIDVEGAEMKVLKGAIKTVDKKDAPDLMIEVVDHHLKEGGSSEKEVLKWLKDYGYKIFAFGSGGLVKYTPYQQRKENNLFCSKNPDKSLMS